MSFGALSANVKEAIGRAATAMGTSTTTGDGGMTPEERQSSKTLVYQCLPSRYGFNPDDLRKADAIEVVIGQGAKPGGGGMLLGQKISPRVAKMRTLPEGIDQRSACRHPDWTGPDDLTIKIHELREITDWQVPIYVKIGATRVRDDVKLAVKAGADVVVIDGMQGGTAATQQVFIETRRHPHAGRPAAGRRGAGRDERLRRGAAHHLRRHPHRGRRRQGAGAGRRRRVDRPGRADGAGLQQRAATCRRASTVDADGRLRQARTRAPGYCHHCHTGRCPVGITTQDPELEQRLRAGIGRAAADELSARC